MARTPGARPRRERLWRWRRNPLRRRSDVAEAWVQLATHVLALLTAVCVGLLAAGALGSSLADRRAEDRPATAVLTKGTADAVPAPVTDDGGAGVWTTVRWTDRDGATHTGRAEVPPGRKAGSTVTVWTDGSGRLVTKPPEGVEAHFQVVMGGVTVGAACGGLILGAGWLVRRRIRHRVLDQWEAEWQWVEPMWRKRMTG
ncbi:hypothetical protein GCM10009601_21920 [Streptomyces thermospinosisporus]|uniref:Integral membrane protein n=1 Tax=Streptomyces thermospinosisporus TaxID=161482 RepID=A0ABP4JKE1_9ACTN